MRLHGLIERVPGTHRYRTTDLGLRRALFFTRAYARLVRAGLSQLRAPGGNSALRTAFCRLERAMDSFCEGAKLAA